MHRCKRIVATFFVLSLLLSGCTEPDPSIKYEPLIGKYVDYWNTGNFEGIEAVLHQDFELRMTPRYESEKIGIYLPFTYNKILNLESGVAFRWKPLVIGSGNIISSLFQGSDRTNIDIYLTTRIMLNRKNKK